MYDIVQGHNDLTHPHSVKILNDFQGFEKKCLSQLESEQLINLNDDKWILTPKGYNKAQEVLNQVKKM